MNTDPLRNFKFTVDQYDSLYDLYEGSIGVMTVEGLALTAHGQHASQPKQPIKLTAGYTHDSLLLDWYNNREHKNLRITIPNELRFDVKNAYPSALIFGQLDAGANALLLVTLELAVEYIDCTRIY